jgi:hypothetical protein
MTSLEEKLHALSKQVDRLRRDIHRLTKLFEARDPNRSLSINEFCAGENMSRAAYDRLEHKPDVFYIGDPDAGRRTPRISPEARARWRQAREREAREAAIAAE